VPLDPGEHTIEATAPGKKAWTTKINVGAERDQKSVEIPLLEAAPVDTTTAGAGSLGAGASRERDVPKSKKGLPLRPIGIGVGAAGIVGLGVGAFFGLRAKTLNEESKEPGHCDAQNVCEPSGGDKRDGAIRAATVSTIAMVAGGVLTAAGVTLFVLGGSKGEAQGHHVEAAPLVGDAELGLSVSGRF
jgi:hypothetical protein